MNSQRVVGLESHSVLNLIKVLRGSLNANFALLEPCTQCIFSFFSELCTAQSLLYKNRLLQRTFKILMLAQHYRTPFWKL